MYARPYRTPKQTNKQKDKQTNKQTNKLTQNQGLVDYSGVDSLAFYHGLTHPPNKQINQRANKQTKINYKRCKLRKTNKQCYKRSILRETNKQSYKRSILKNHKQNNFTNVAYQESFHALCLA